MSISTGFDRDQNGSSDRDIFTHWAWALPILLIVAALGLRQIELYPPGPDEFYSMNNSGFLVESPFSPFDVIESLYQNSPNHMPGYFLLLNMWGNLTSNELATGRVLTILCALLSIATIYRLARDFIAPVAGLFAIIIVASNAFYSFYIPNLRMYSLLVCLAAAVLWLYLRIMHRLQIVQRKDFIALGAAVFALLNVHAFSITFLATLAIYHSFLVKSSHRWKSVVVSVCAATILAAPWYLVVLTRGTERVSGAWGGESVGSWDTITAWLKVATNGQPLLLALSITGLFLSSRILSRQPKTYTLLFVPFLLILGVVTDATSFVHTSAMRYQLAGWPLLILAMATGLFALYCHHRLLGVLVVLWLIAGINFHINNDWKQYIGGQYKSHESPPWQVISRLAARSELDPFVIGYRIKDALLEWQSYVNYSQNMHYFDRLGLGIQLIGDPHELEVFVSHRFISSPFLWIVFQEAIPSAKEISDIEARLTNLGYERCHSHKVGVDSTILQFAWQLQDCQALDLKSIGRTELINYQFYGLQLDNPDKVIRFVDAWNALAEIPLDSYKMSYQLISEDWVNVTQLELPLVHESVLRQFSIDISDVNAGSYQLMAIVYNAQTNTRLEWLDVDSNGSAMLHLGEIEIPDNDMQ